MHVMHWVRTHDRWLHINTTSICTNIYIHGLIINKTISLNYYDLATSSMSTSRPQRGSGNTVDNSASPPSQRSGFDPKCRSIMIFKILFLDGCPSVIVVVDNAVVTAITWHANVAIRFLGNTGMLFGALSLRSPLLLKSDANPSQLNSLLYL